MHKVYDFVCQHVGSPEGGININFHMHSNIIECMAILLFLSAIFFDISLMPKMCSTSRKAAINGQNANKN